MSTIDWSSLDFTSGNNSNALNDQDNYIAKLLSLDPNLPYPGTNLTPGAGMLSSPEASDSASPESDAAPSSRQSSTSSGVPVQNAPMSNNNNNNSLDNHRSSTLDSSTSSDMVSHHEKRKAAETKGSAAAIKDRRSSSSDSATALPVSMDSQHTHPDEDDSGDDIDGKKGKSGKTSEKRKEQNRAAQRAFRERKERHLKDLEDRVFSLEQESSQKDAENVALKQLMERLQNENERLKVYETAFSFSYDKDVSNSATMPTSAQFKPPTPPTAQDEIADLSSFTSSAPSSSAPSISSPFDANAFLATSTASSMPMFGTSPSAFALPQPSSYSANSIGSSTSSPLGFSPPPTDSNRQSSLDDRLFLGSLSTGTSPASTNAESAASTHITTPPELSTADLFSAYRDTYGAPTLASLNDFDSLFGTNGLVAGVPPASSSAGPTADDLLSAFVKSPSPAANSTGSASTSSPLSGPGAVSPSCALNQEGKFEFDVDNLCAEMKLKATCQEKAREALRSAMAADANAVAKAYPQQQ